MGLTIAVSSSGRYFFGRAYHCPTLLLRVTTTTTTARRRISSLCWWLSAAAATVVVVPNSNVVAAMSTSTTSTTIIRRAAIAQLCSTSDKLLNLCHVAKCAGWAKRDGASMLFLPECFGFMGTSSQQTLEQAEPPIIIDHANNEKKKKNDPKVNEILRETIQKAAQQKKDDESSQEDTVVHPDKTASKMISLLDGLQTIAKESNLWISAGGMHTLGAPPREDDGQSRVYNTHVIVDNVGQVQCWYNKIHLFDVSIPNQVNLKESNTTAPGTDLVVCDSPIGKLGLSTCYDIRFPEMYLPLVQQKGAQIILVPSAFTVPTGRAHWHTLLRARAIENQCYVLAAAQYGQHNEKRKSYGHSLAVNPWGDVLADAGGYDNNDDDSEANTATTPTPPPSIVTCDIDLESLESIRQRMPIQQHRNNAVSFFGNNK